MKIFYQVDDKKTGLVVAIYKNKEQAHKHAKQNENYFIAIRWDY